MRVGSPWINQTAKTSSDVPVHQIIINSGYQPRRYWSWVGRNNDIALLKLQWGLKYSKYVWPVCLPGLEFVLEDSSFCVVTGWGYPQVDGKSPSPPTLGVWWEERACVWLRCPMDGHFWSTFFKELTDPATFLFVSPSLKSPPPEGFVSEHIMVN